MAGELPAQIQLRSFQVSDFKLSTGINFDPNLTSRSDSTVNLQHRSHLINEDKKVFIIEFDFGFQNKDFSMSIVFKALFTNSYDIDKSFLDSPFVRMNAPAIAFPFLRSFITTVTSNAGYNPLILPAINFSTSIKSEEKADKV